MVSPGCAGCCGVTGLESEACKAAASPFATAKNAPHLGGTGSGAWGACNVTATPPPSTARLLAVEKAENSDTFRSSGTWKFTWTSADGSEGTTTARTGATAPFTSTWTPPRELGKGPEDGATYVPALSPRRPDTYAVANAPPYGRPEANEAALTSLMLQLS